MLAGFDSSGSVESPLKLRPYFWKCFDLVSPSSSRRLRPRRSVKGFSSFRFSHCFPFMVPDYSVNLNLVFRFLLVDSRRTYCTLGFT
ncbi:hypothetical protein SAY87_025097 [Trapa incisa]|uniref:Uncharacterized protein n=1 Tax=Trapa incisa TaxID=236973 RepID=A0AAN7GQ68_9MYRT|nr:hypothetical protein SAY87_025097 [Trapa incisa]